jgi:hypothetical protein
MRDGIGQSGAGLSDNRLAGEDLQHNRQTRTADEAPQVKRMMTQAALGGGPMKEHMDMMEQKYPMHEQMEEEKMRHEKAMDHQRHHLEKHQVRNYDSQHGQDTYQY